MAKSIKSSTELVEYVLKKLWNVEATPVPSMQGVSRATWQVGTEYWLSQAEELRQNELAEKARFLDEFGRFLKDHPSSIAVPDCVRTLEGQLLALDSDYVWGITRHLPGSHPNAQDPNIYPGLIEGLAKFHSTLRSFPKTQPFELPFGICVKARRYISQTTSNEFVPLTSDATEREILRTAAAWLQPRLASFEALPRQIVHGDFTPQNVLFGGNGANSLSAVLDFEAIAVDPIHVDIGNVCSTLIMWSKFEHVEEHIASALATYTRFAGITLDPAQIHTAIVARWFCHYWDWRERSAFCQFGHEVEERLCARIASAIAYVSNI